MATLARLASLAGLDGCALAALETYVDEVVGWRGANITGLGSREAVVDTLVGDALAVLDLEAVRGAGLVPDGPWYDLGSGAGVPGIPVSIALPAVRMWLLESVRRKCDFLRHVVATLGLQGRVQVVCMRSEDYVRERSECRDSGQMVLVRAVGPLPAMVELAAPLARAGGDAVVCTSASRAAAESTAADRAARACGFAAPAVYPLSRSPVAGSVAVVLHKTERTPEWLPRRAGLARRRPLGR